MRFEPLWDEEEEHHNIGELIVRDGGADAVASNMIAYFSDKFSAKLTFMWRKKDPAAVIVSGSQLSDFMRSPEYLTKVCPTTTPKVGSKRAPLHK